MLPRWFSGKESAYNAGDIGSIPGSGRSPGEGNGNPLQYSCLGNPMDRGAWEAIVHGVTKSQAWPGDWARTHSGLTEPWETTSPVSGFPFHFPLPTPSSSSLRSLRWQQLSFLTTLQSTLLLFNLPWKMADHHWRRKMPLCALVSDTTAFVLGPNTVVSGHFPSVKK